MALEIRQFVHVSRASSNLPPVFIAWELSLLTGSLILAAVALTQSSLRRRRKLRFNILANLPDKGLTFVFLSKEKTQLRHQVPSKNPLVEQNYRIKQA